MLPGAYPSAYCLFVSGYLSVAGLRDYAEHSELRLEVNSTSSACNVLTKEPEAARAKAPCSFKAGRRDGRRKSTTV